MSMDVYLYYPFSSLDLKSSVSVPNHRKFTKLFMTISGLVGYVEFVILETTCYNQYRTFAVEQGILVTNDK